MSNSEFIYFSKGKIIFKSVHTYIYLPISPNTKMLRYIKTCVHTYVHLQTKWTVYIVRPQEIRTLTPLSHPNTNPPLLCRNILPLPEANYVCHSYELWKLVYVRIYINLYTLNKIM